MGIKVGNYALLGGHAYMRIFGHWCYLRKGFWYTLENKRIGSK